MLKVLLDQRHLILCRRIFDDDSLHAAGVRHSEDVSGLREVKGHNAMPHVVNMLLLGLRKGAHTAENQEKGDRSTENL